MLKTGDASTDAEAAVVDERPALDRDASLITSTAVAPHATDAEGRGAVVPRATYRLQLNATFTFKQATALIPYLADLGISHVYCSPYFRARPGSMHGYDVVDHNAFNPEIGTREDFEEFVATLRRHGMGHILDFVPNHVGVMGAENVWWMDVLENGRASRYAEFFDIDWFPPNPALAGKLLVPALGGPYGSILEAGELPLRYEPEQGSFAVFYHHHRFPLDPQTYPAVLERVLAHAVAADAAPDQRLQLESLTAAFRKLPDRETASPDEIVERDRDKEFHKSRLAALIAAAPALRAAIDATVATLSGDGGSGGSGAGGDDSSSSDPAAHDATHRSGDTKNGGNRIDPRSFDSLHDLLERQCYRLAYWRVAADDINYRRFFDVNDLAALRMENPQVFESTHRLLLELVRENKLDGVRIDHPDGLYDPAQYFHNLQREAALAKRHLPAAGRIEVDDAPGLAIYLLVEKITASFERLPQSWPVHGTTGYNFTNVVNGVFVDSRAKARLDRAYQSFIIDYVEWPDVAYDSKGVVLRTALASELNVLANQLARIAQADRHTRDFTLSNLRHALTEVIARFPVYRTYVTDTASDDDKRYIDWAIARARRQASSTDIPLLDFVRSMLLADTSDVDEPMHAQVRAFARKFQQVTAPVTAKGVEDTALYRFTRLSSLNEVGGEPESFGVSVRQFHSDAQLRARHWPHEMLATSTHDTKRAEDVRARINVLSEMVSVWRKSIQRWSRMNRARRKVVDDLPAPGPHAEYLLYQTLLGTWPLGELDDEAFATYRERIEEYMVKASREGKRRTSWANVNADYEDALRQFIRLALERREGNHFATEIGDLARVMARFGFLNSLSQTLCKLTAPGVPDIYQGNEIWDDSLVDPDNRRPVDYEHRKRLLADVKRWTQDATAPRLQERLRDALESIEDGRCKLYVTARTLEFRRSHEALFGEGDYLPLRVSGEYAAHLVAYARTRGDQFAIVAVPRLCARLFADRDAGASSEEVWADTRIELPRRLSLAPLRHLLDGSTLHPQLSSDRPALPAAALFAHFPVALLTA